jgi:hypothetical protein
LGPYGILETMHENQPPFERRWLRLAPAVTLAAALAVSSCASEVSITDLPGEVTVHADIGPVLTDQARCNGGADRPCAALIRVSPDQNADFLNADKNQTSPVKWPIEEYGNAPGDPVIIVCQVFGPPITSAPQSGDKQVSNVWDVVRVPYAHFAASRQNLQELPLFSFGYASDLLLGNNGIIDKLARCAINQNPAGAKPVK